MDHTNVQAVAMTTIHTTPLAMTLPQHSVRHMKGQAMAMTTIHITPLETILPQQLLWHVKGQFTAMTIIRIILLATSLPPHSLWHMNGQATTMIAIRTVALQTFLLLFLAHKPPLVTRKKKSSRDSSRKRPDKVKTIICKSLTKITSFLICSGMRFINSTLDRHLV
jgi:hypothetical protein